MTMSCGPSSIAAPRGSAATLSSTTWRQLWRTSRDQALPTDPGDERDRIAQYPAQLATGYKRDIDLRNGVGFTLHRYQFHQDLIVTQWPEEETGCLEFVFNLSSISKYREGPYLTAGQHRLLGVYQAGGQLPGMLHGLLNGLAGKFVELHPVHVLARQGASFL